MSITSRVPALIDYLVTEFQAAATLGQANPPVIVYDGPATTADPAPLALHVGVDDTFGEGPATAATSEQTAVGLAQKREEIAVIRCAALAWSGSDDIRTLRLAAYGITGAVEDLVRADTTLATQAGAAIARPGVTGMTLQQSNSTTGAWAQVTFEITFKALIGA